MAIQEGSGQGSTIHNYAQSLTYDDKGRVFQEFDASGDNRGTRNVYNDYGYLSEIREARDGDGSQGNHVRTYWKVLAMDARDNVIEAEMGNGMKVVATHDVKTGALRSRSDRYDGSGDFAQLTEYEWDEIGQLVRRNQYASAALFEYFEYDDRNRLTASWHSTTGSEGAPGGQGAANWTLGLRMRYDISGNIICKSDVSNTNCNSGTNYTYHTGTGSGPGPHAVAQVSTHNGNRHYEYDANGNVTKESKGPSITARRMEYTPSNLLRRVTTPGQGYSEFHYGIDRQRVIRRDGNQAGVSRRVHYIGNVEAIYDANGNLERFQRAIAGVALMHIQANGHVETSYQHRDHLGSIIALSDEFGKVIARMSFDAWGKRRDPSFAEPLVNWRMWTQPLPAWANSMVNWTDRGYTAHEHLDDHGIIHMNGRIYDPHLARFLQADPFVEDPGTLNRYTYVHNNPLVYYDPSGYFSLKSFLKIGAVVAISVITQGVLLPMFKAGSVAAYATAAAAGALSGYIMTGTLEGTLWGAFSAVTFYGIGQKFGGSLGEGMGVMGSGYSKAGLARATAAHGVAGGTLSKLQGGRFGHGLASAGITKVASPAIEFAANDNSFAEVTMVTIAGGSISSISGGKFANGAVTVAMAYAFGQVAHRDGDGVPDFDLDSSEGRQQYAQWIWENRGRFGIEVPDGTSFEYIDEFIMITQVGRVVCDGPCPNIDYQRRIQWQENTSQETEVD